MPVFADFDLAKLSDGVIKITLAPPQDVGGLGFKFTLSKRFNASASGVILSRQVTSGYGGGESGITVTDSGLGYFSITAPTPEETSGREPGNYAYQFEALDSGARGPLAQGFLVLGTNIRY